jgi:inositol-phosphate transport system ATP-binding protein
MADRIICMNNGENAQIGTPDDLYRRSNNLFVAGFIGTPPMNLLKGNADGRRLQVANASFDLNAQCSGAVTFGLRPEDITLTSAEIALFHGEIVTVEPMGSEVFYTIDTPAGIIHALEYGEAVRHAPDTKVGITAKSELTLVFDASGNRIADLNADFLHHAAGRARVLEPAN